MESFVFLDYYLAWGWHIYWDTEVDYLQEMFIEETVAIIFGHTMWDFTSTTRDWSCTPCGESVESYHQGGPKETVTELMSLCLAEGESTFLPGFNLPVRLYVAVIEKVQHEAWWRKSVEIQ